MLHKHITSHDEDLDVTSRMPETRVGHYLASLRGLNAEDFPLPLQAEARNALSARL